MLKVRVFYSHRIVAQDELWAPPYIDYLVFPTFGVIAPDNAIFLLENEPIFRQA